MRRTAHHTFGGSEKNLSQTTEPPLLAKPSRDRKPAAVATCSIQHDRGRFNYFPCGKPANFLLLGTKTRVCRDCMRLLNHMPRTLFVQLEARR